MHYEQFVANYISELRQFLPENVKLERGIFKKVNEVLDGISVRYPNSSIAPAIYFNGLYQKYQDGYSVEQLAAGTVRQLKQIRDIPPKLPVLTQEAARQNLYCVLINVEANEELLRTVPHERMEDLAVIPRFKVGEEGSFIVSNDMCRHLHLTSEEVMEAAHFNTEKAKFECQNMTDTICELMREQGIADEDIAEFLMIQGENCPMYIVSNPSHVDGASALIVTEAMESAFYKIKEEHPDMENVYILGSSRHELILVPDSTVQNTKELSAIHQDIQNTIVSKSDKLSDRIYKFNAQTKQITLADSQSLIESRAVIMETVKGRSR